MYVLGIYVMVLGVSRNSWHLSVIPEGCRPPKEVEPLGQLARVLS